MSKHYSDAMVVRCSDDRYSDGRELDATFLSILKKEKANDCFQAYGFGAGLEIVKEAYWPLWQDRIRLAKSLGIKRVIVVQHIDCGAVKAEYQPKNEQEERQIHRTIIHAAKRFFQEYATEFEFVAYIQDFYSFEQVV
jgi:hypothetical protein